MSAALLVPARRDIVDRRSVAERLHGASRADVASLLRDALSHGRAEISRRLAERPYAGTESAAATALQTIVLPVPGGPTNKMPRRQSKPRL